MGCVCTSPQVCSARTCSRQSLRVPSAPYTAATLSRGCRTHSHRRCKDDVGIGWRRWYPASPVEQSAVACGRVPLGVVFVQWARSVQSGHPPSKALDGPSRKAPGICPGICWRDSAPSKGGRMRPGRGAQSLWQARSGQVTEAKRNSFQISYVKLGSGGATERHS